MGSKDSGNKSDDPYEGVVYESTRKISVREDTPRPLKKQGKNNMALFYIVTLVIAIILCMIIFAVVFQSIKSGKETPQPAAAPRTANTAANTESPVSIGDLKKCSGVIQVTDPSGAWMDILDVSSNTPYHLIIKQNTKLQDKSGAPLLPSEFSAGDIIDARYYPQTNEAETISQSPIAWIMRERDNIRIDTAAKTIMIDNDIYSYNGSLVTLYNNKPFSLDLIQPIDVLTVTGVGKTAWRVTLIKGHGTLYISNAGNIANGTLEIDNGVYRGLEESGPISLTEGSHHLVVKGDNIETYIQDIVIEANKSQYIKLEDLIKLKTGWLSVQVNTQGYTLFADNEEKPAEQPINLAYGSHVIRVEKEGYIAFEQTVDIQGLTASLKVDLHPLLRLGKIIATSVPEGAQVYVDSAYVGDTPVNVSVETGEHTLLVSKEGYLSISFPVNVSLNTDPINIELQPELPEATFEPSPSPEDTETPEPAFTPEPPSEPPAETEIPTPAPPGSRIAPFLPPG